MLDRFKITNCMARDAMNLPMDPSIKEPFIMIRDKDVAGWSIWMVRCTRGNGRIIGKTVMVL